MRIAQPCNELAGTAAEHDRPSMSSVLPVASVIAALVAGLVLSVAMWDQDHRGRAGAFFIVVSALLSYAVWRWKIPLW